MDAPDPPPRRPRHPGPRATRHRSVTAALLAALLAGGLAGPGARGARRGYRNDALGIQSFELPRGWLEAPQLPWPGVLVMARGARGGRDDAGTEGARLVLTGQRVAPGHEALAMAADARATLLRQGFGDPRVSDRPPGPGGELRSQVDATFDKGRQAMRQLYLVAGEVAVVVTLTAPLATWSRALRDFELACDSLVLVPPSAAPPPPPPLAAPASADGGAG